MSHGISHRYKHTQKFIRTHLIKSGKGEKRKLPHDHRMTFFVNNAYFWHFCDSLKREGSSNLNGFFFPSNLGTRRAVSPQTGVAQPGRGGCVDSPSLLMEKAHNVSSVHRLTLEASQPRTKLSQSDCPPWVSGLSSGFVKLLRDGTHQGHPSHRAVGVWPGAHQQ